MPHTLDEVGAVPIEADQALSAAQKEFRWAERQILEEERLVGMGLRSAQGTGADPTVAESGAGSVSSTSNKVRLDPLSQRHVANVLEWHDAAQKQLSALQMPIDNGDINRYSTNRLRVPTHTQPVARPMMISPPQSLLGTRAPSTGS